MPPYEGTVVPREAMKEATHIRGMASVYKAELEGQGCRDSDLGS